MPLPGFYFNDDLGYSDMFLLKIAELLGSQWMRLGIYLRIPSAKLESMNKEKSPCTMAVEMLNKWWRKCPAYLRSTELIISLRETYRNDLVLFTKEFFKEKNLEDFDVDSTRIQMFFLLLGEQMPSDWKKVATYLHISYDEVKAISKPPQQDNESLAFQVLKTWQKSSGSATHHLMKVMYEMNRGDIIEMIFLEFDKKTGTCS